MDASHFIATKLEAWLGRGSNDVFHHDLEDVIAVVDGREERAWELFGVSADVRSFVAEMIGSLLSQSEFVESLPGHLPGDPTSQDRIGLLLARLRNISELERATEVLEEIDTAALNDAGTVIPATRPPQTLGAWVTVRSSNLHSVSYDPPTTRLGVRFHSGGVYVYFGG